MSSITDKDRGAVEPENQYPFIEKRGMTPCSEHDRRISLLEQSAGQTQRTMEAVSTKLDLILAQITKIALLEQKHDNSTLDINRAHTKIEQLAKEVDALAIETRNFISYSKGMTKVIWSIGGVVFALLVKVLFFAASNGMTP